MIQRFWTVAAVEVATLHAAPAEVHAASCVRRQGVVDLLPGALADVADRQVAVRPVEREAPGVSQAVGPDLVAAGDSYERIVRRDRVRLSLWTELGIDPQHLPAEVFEVLGTPEGVAPASTVTGGQVEVSIRPELELAAIVVRLARGAGSRSRHGAWLGRRYPGWPRHVGTPRPSCRPAGRCSRRRTCGLVA